MLTNWLTFVGADPDGHRRLEVAVVEIVQGGVQLQVAAEVLLQADFVGVHEFRLGFRLGQDSRRPRSRRPCSRGCSGRRPWCLRPDPTGRRRCRSARLTCRQDCVLRRPSPGRSRTGGKPRRCRPRGWSRPLPPRPSSWALARSVMSSAPLPRPPSPARRVAQAQGLSHCGHRGQIAEQAAPVRRGSGAEAAQAQGRIEARSSRRRCRRRCRRNSAPNLWSLV